MYTQFIGEYLKEKEYGEEQEKEDLVEEDEVLMSTHIYIIFCKRNLSC